MRYDTLNAGSYLVWRLQYTGRLKDVRDDGDLIYLELRTGERLMIYLIERPITLSELQQHLTENTSRQIHTLMLFWIDMLLPPDGSVYPLTDWMAALVTLHQGKIFGFEVAGREAYFVPVYFEGGGYQRQVRYGSIVNYAHLHGQTVTTRATFMPGTWRIATFDAPGAGRARGARTDAPRADNNPLAVHFQTLGLRSDANRERVKQAYRQLARTHHPDLNQSTQSDQQMKRINEAYNRLIRHFDQTDS